MEYKKEKEILKEINQENDFIKLDESSTDNKNSIKNFDNEKRIQFDFSLDSQKEKNKNTEEKHIEILNNNNSSNNEQKNKIQNYNNFSDTEYKSEVKLNNKSEENTFDTLDEPVYQTLVIKIMLNI